MVDRVCCITSFQGEVLKFHYVISFKRLCRAGSLPELEADTLGIAMPVGRGPGLGTRLELFTFKYFRSIRLKSFGALDARATKITKLWELYLEHLT
jgi:hypothetical protein